MSEKKEAATEKKEATTEKTANYLLAGVDDGYAETKVVTRSEKVSIASLARAGLFGLSSMGSDDKVGGSYETNGRKFTVSDKIDGEGTRFDDYPFSDMNRVIVHHALRLAGLGGKKVKIATGLQVSAYFKGDDRNEEHIQLKQESMMKEVKALDGTPVAEIVEHIVLSEAVASWFDYAFDDKGTQLEMEGPCGVIDIGGKTTDCVTVLEGHQIDHARSGTGEVGVLDVYEILGSRLRAQFGDGLISRKVYDQAVRTGTIKRFGKPQDVKALVNAAVDDVAERILTEAKRHFGNGAHLDVVLFVGGGAAFMTKLTSHFPNAKVLPDPEFANARGMYKFLKLNA
jgi:plasmid segregation protein ParM